ncbi:hypothetical protein QN277_009635 [Acacia crassicarpa]|uniref:CCHC-type domain-containing protein n=1 Tax=Acacia crassicarpa TaxID=499986 RepID=A0AAE1M9B3_9FABA|nr:hypothetical protein QN277_009635 [Acacia crassicarpa]
MEGFQISSPLIWKEEESERVLVGKILASKVYTKSATEVILRKAWNLQDGFDVIAISDNAFMFKFTASEEFDRVLRGRPWSINGSLLNLMERTKYKSFEEFDFSRCPVWIQLHNVPMEAMCLENAITIGGYVGEVVLAEDPVYNGRLLRSFLRVRVVLDLRKPLSSGFWLPRPDGQQVWISIRFEKLQNFCYNCGKIGHENKSCGSVKLMSLAHPSEPRFGDWITMNACRSWDEVVTVVNKDWAEAGSAMKRKDEALNRRRNKDNSHGNKMSSSNDENLFVIKVLKSAHVEES